MIKIIHCADVHLGSGMDSRLPSDKAAERKSELRAAFSGMVRYAADNGVKVIMLSGDVFDSDRPLKKDKEFFYSVVKSYPNIDFLYLRGNHDGEQRYEEKPQNLKTFSDEWITYSYGNVDISGVEMDEHNARSLYSTLKTNAERLNIVMLHGQISDGAGKDKVDLSALRGKNIDYLALGHVHTFSQGRLDDRGEYAYCGCLEGRGFDETGEKGFVLLEADSGISVRFVPRSIRKIMQVTVDVSGSKTPFEACLAARAAIECDKKDLLRLVLTGEISFDNQTLAREAEKEFSGDYYFVSVKDKTVRKFDMQALMPDKSLRSEFIRTVLASDMPEERKQRVISAGLKALAGREPD